MAKIISSLSSCARTMTSWEKRFGRRLESLLEVDYLCWFDIPLGKKRRYPDYIVLPSPVWRVIPRDQELVGGFLTTANP